MNCLVVLPSPINGCLLVVVLFVFCFAYNSLHWSLQGLGFCSFVCFLSLSIREASRIQHNGLARRNGIKQGPFQERGELEMGLSDVFA